MLDKKLDRILESLEPGVEIADAKAEIKQAFEDAGYFDLRTNTVNGRKWMSGEDWLERFERELGFHTKVDYGREKMFSETQVVLAARRASEADDGR